MTRYEYKVLPAPTRGEKSRSARTTPERFALALTNLMNLLGRDGWDYVRADTLPCDERVGLTGKQTVFQNMLVFRRVLAEAGVAEAAAPPAHRLVAEPALLASPLPAAPPLVWPAEGGPTPPIGPARVAAE